jgi:serine/threonine-protein kinase
MTSSFIGKVVDNYRIIENLGIGGMGVVFKAIHVKLDKLFALKMITPGLAMNENFIKRFQTEAKSLAKFEDPNIVRIYDLREYEDQWFIVMEYVEGYNLLDIIRQKGAFPLQHAISILRQILTAIGHAHSAGIVHRDLKPNNVMISTDGKVKITDFGLAKDQTNRTTSHTVTSGGTLYYMSPEHVKGFQFTDKRSDIYSIGMTFYEMITGTVPFKDLQSDFDIRESIMRKDTVKPSEYNKDIPAELENIVMKSISKDPDERFQTTDEMLNALQGFLAEDPEIDSDFALVEMKQTVRYTESEFKFGKVPDPILPKYLRPNKKRLKKIGLFGAPLLIILILLYLFFPSSTTKDQTELDSSIVPQLTIVTQPSMAAIVLENKPIGETPINQYSLVPGSYSLRITKENYQPIDTTIVVNPGNNINLAVSLQPIEPVKEVTGPAALSEQKIDSPAKSQKSASVSINSNPENADVWLNGQLEGYTPLTLSDLSPGSYQIAIKKEGYTEYNNQLVFQSGKNSDLLADLSPSGGDISLIFDPPSADVFIDGKKIDNTGLPLSLQNIPTGTHKIEVKKPGFYPVSEEIDVKQGEILNKKYSLERQYGKLSVQVRPWGSIYIDNELKKESADTKYQVTLPVQEYKIKVIHPTLGIWEKMISVKSDTEEEITLNFNRKVNVSVAAFDEKGLPLNAEILFDNEDTGKSTPAKLKLRVGNHKLMLKLDGYDQSSGEKEIFVDNNSINEHTIILKKME